MELNIERPEGESASPSFDAAVLAFLAGAAPACHDWKLFDLQLDLRHIC
jgi:hypothetical protein